MSRQPVAEPAFAEIAEPIASARLRGVQAVDTRRDHELVSSAPTQLAGVRGPGEKVAALLRQSSWTHHQNASEGDDA